MEKQDEINKENEIQRLNFFIKKALDSYEHFIQTLLPYYVSEVSSINAVFFSQLNEIYKAGFDEPHVKKEILKRVAQYFTYKALPIDYEVLTPKKELVNKVHYCFEEGRNHVEKLRNEVACGVQ